MEGLKNAIKLKRDDFRVQIRKNKTNEDLMQKRKKIMDRNFKNQQSKNDSDIDQNQNQGQMQNLGQNNTFSVKYKNILTDKEYQQMKDTVNQEQTIINQRQQQKQETEVELQNLYKEMIGAYSDNDYNLLQQLLEILFNFTRNGEELLNEYHVPLVMKCGFLDIFSKILESKQKVQEFPLLYYNCISSLANLCSCSDKYVVEILNHNGEFLEKMNAILLESIYIGDFLQFFRNVSSAVNNQIQNQNQDDMNLYRQIDFQINNQLNYFKVAEAIYFTFANMMGNLDRDVNLQIKGYIMQMDIIKTVQETFQNIQSFIDELNQLVYSQKKQCNFFNAEEDCSGYKHEQIREFFQTFSWFISQLIRDPISKAWRPLLDNLKPCLIVLFDNYTKTSCNDSKIIQNVMWALHNGTGSSNFYINSFCQLMGNKRLEVLISFVHKAKLQLQYQAIKLLSNLLSGEDTVVQNLIDIGILKALEYGLDIQYEIFRGEVVWSISNICACSPLQLQYFLKSSLFSKLLEKGKTETSYKIKREIQICLGNLLCCCEENQIQEFLVYNIDFMELVMEGLKSYDDKCVMNLIDGLENCLNLFKNVYTTSQQNIMAIEFERYGLSQQLDQLQLHNNVNINNKVSQIIEKYFINSELDYGNDDNSNQLF